MMKVHLVAFGAADASTHIAFCVGAAGQQPVDRHEQFLVLVRECSVQLYDRLFVSYKPLKNGMQFWVSIHAVTIALWRIFRPNDSTAEICFDDIAVE